MQLSEQVSSITRETIVPNLFDQVSISSPFLYMTLKNATSWTSGTKFEIPVKYAKNTQGGVTGVADRLDSSRSNNRTKMQFEPKMIYKPVVVADIEVTLNSGDEQVLALITTEMDSQRTDLMDDFADILYTGTGVGDDWDSFQGAADDGTNYATYGSLSRTTYPALNGYLNAAVGSLTLAAMATAVDNVEHGTDAPTEAYTTRTVWTAYEALLTPTVRANYSTSGYPQMSEEGILAGGKGLGASQGFSALTFRGIPIMKDDKCPSGDFNWVNSRKSGKARNFGFNAITLKGSKFSKVNFQATEGKAKGTFGSRRAPLGFNFRDMMSPVDQLADVGHLIYTGDICSASPRLQGRLTGVTA